MEKVKQLIMSLYDKNYLYKFEKYWHSWLIRSMFYNLVREVDVNKRTVTTLLQLAIINKIWPLYE